MTKLAAPFLLALAGLVATAAHAQDVKRGEQRAAQCIGCHGIAGYQSSFPEVHRVPMISGQNAQYIVASLQAYAKGERKHPTMRGIAGMLTEQEMADLGAFYEQHGASMIKPVADTPARQPSAAVQALLTKGACASCHGVNFNKPINGAYPKIAGQHADYLYVSLRAYGIEGNRTVGRANGIMSAQVKPFTRAALKQLAEYIGSLPGDLRVVPQSRFR
ncbi:MAG: c-type cytochrome [Betaproteobacteria bacterium]